MFSPLLLPQLKCICKGFLVCANEMGKVLRFASEPCQRGNGMHTLMKTSPFSEDIAAKIRLSRVYL